MAIERRADRVAFRIAGDDATRLLHDVLTASVTETEGEARWFALLAPQGKILAEGLIGWAHDAYWLDVHESVAENFFKRMKMYRLRAQLEIAPLGESHAVGWSAAAPGAGIAHSDTRSQTLGFRVVAPLEQTSDWVEGTGYAVARIAAGVPELGPDFGADDVFPHDIGMDHLGGVDFKKGCFVGQEVVSRMQHRGTARRRPAIVSGIETGQPGDALSVDGRSVGSIGEPLDGRAAGIVRMDKVTPESAVMLNGAAVNLALPEWARYAFAESAGGADD